ncbi:MAG TPA: hypothetical protein VIT44_00410, partial [Cyclobacteriaceae bacterium]
MKLKLFCLFLMAFPFVLLGQESKSDLVKGINKDIWIPFITGVNSNNAELYNSVNAEDFYWVRSGEKTRIMNRKEYIEDARIVMQGRAEKKMQTELDVRFTERNINSEFASERCVIKYTSTETGKNPVTSYGITQIFSRKQDGVW